MLICVLKKSTLLILCFKTMLPNKSKILQMIIKSPHKLLDKNRSWHRPSHANRGSGRDCAGFRGSFFWGQGSTNRPFLRPSKQYCTTTYTKPKHNQETNNNDNNNIFISDIKYTNITPPANSKANWGRWSQDDITELIEAKVNLKVNFWLV